MMLAIWLTTFCRVSLTKLQEFSPCTDDRRVPCMRAHARGQVDTRIRVVALTGITQVVLSRGSEQSPGGS